MRKVKGFSFVETILFIGIASFLLTHQLMHSYSDYQVKKLTRVGYDIYYLLLQAKHESLARSQPLYIYNMGQLNSIQCILASTSLNKPFSCDSDLSTAIVYKMKISEEFIVTSIFKDIDRAIVFNGESYFSTSTSSYTLYLKNFIRKNRSKITINISKYGRIRLCQETRTTFNDCR